MRKDNILILIGNSLSLRGVSDLQTQQNYKILPASFGLFNSGEPFVEIFAGAEKDFERNAKRLKGKTVVIVQSGGAPVRDNVMDLLMAAHTLKSYGAARVTAVMPFLPLMRQDRAFDKRFCSLGAAFLAAQMKGAGIDAVVTLTPHSKAGIGAFEKVFGSAFSNVSANDIFADEITKLFGRNPQNLAIGAPDGADKPADEGQRRARNLAQAVFGAPDNLFKVAKAHTAASDTVIRNFEGDVADRTCVIVDDMIDGGSTMINAARLLKDKGAKSVVCMATHGILSGDALEKLLRARTATQESAIDRLVLTDSLPGVAGKAAALANADPACTGHVEIIPVTGYLVERADMDCLPRPKKPRSSRA